MVLSAGRNAETLRTLPASRLVLTALVAHHFALGLAWALLSRLRSLRLAGSGTLPALVR